MKNATLTDNFGRSPSHSARFEQAREALVVFKTISPQLSRSERETLLLLLDREALTTIDESTRQAESGTFEPLEVAVKS